MCSPVLVEPSGTHRVFLAFFFIFLGWNTHIFLAENPVPALVIPDRIAILPAPGPDEAVPVEQATVQFLFRPTPTWSLPT